MRIKDFKARYAELKPYVTLFEGNLMVAQCELDKIPSVYDYLENVRYTSYVETDGTYHFRVWANTPDRHYLPQFEDYEAPIDYFKAYCESLDYELIDVRNIDENFFLLECRDDVENANYLQLLFADLNSGMADTVLLASCDKAETAEFELLMYAFDYLRRFNDAQQARIAKLRAEYAGGET